MTELVVGPITAEWIAAYALASGDDNPLHTAPSSKRAAIVHGALLAALAEKYVRWCLPRARIHAMNFRFLQPVRAGESVTYSLGNARQVSLDNRVMTEQRITARVGEARPCLMGACTFELIGITQ